MQERRLRHTKLNSIIARLKLKELEMVDRISVSHNQYVIRCITNPDTYEFIAVNGDWNKVTGHPEKECLGMTWLDFIPKDEVDVVKREAQSLFEKNKSFENLCCNILGINGEKIPVCWKAKYYPEINAVVSIGKVAKKKPKKNKRWK
jgi:hypothetical protein